MSTLILAAGTQTRWNHGLPVDSPKIKQLVNIQGDLLIVRTQRQFEDTVVVTHNREISLHSTISYKPERYKYLVETLYSTTDLWKDKTIILLGDVMYTDKAVQRIRECKELMFFGNSIEIFALVFMREDHRRIEKALNKIIIESTLGNIRGKLWHLYRHLNNINLNKHKIEGMFSRVLDNTQDFDNWDQYVKYAKGKKVRA